MNPQAALLAALANLTQQITGLGNVVTILAEAESFPAGGGSGAGDEIADRIDGLSQLLEEIEDNTFAAAQWMAYTSQRAPASTATARAGGDGGGAGGAGEGSALAGVLGSVFSVAVAKIAVVIAPLVGLAAVIGSVTSGFQPLLASMRVFASTLGAFLLPVFSLLAAAVLASADAIFANLLPELERWYTFVAEEMVPKLVEFVGAVEEAAKWLREFAKDPVKKGAEAVEENAPILSEAGQGWGGLIAMWMYGINSMKINGQVIPGIKPGNRAPAPPSPPADTGPPSEPQAPTGPRQPTPRERFNDALRDVIQSMRMSMGPPGAVTSVSELNRRNQQALLTTDPIQARQDRMFRQVLDLLEKVVRNGEKKPDPMFGPNGTGGGRK